MIGRWSIVAGVLISVAVGANSANSSAEPSAAEKETARTLMKQGRELREAGNHQGALEAFVAADAIMRVTTTGLEVGKEQLDLGLLVEARDTFLRVSRIPDQPGEAPAITEARKQAKELAGAIEPRIPTLKIVVSGANLDDVELTIDGAAVAKAVKGLPQRLDPGTHEIVATRGVVKRKASVELKESETKEAPLDLTPTAEDAALEKSAAAAPEPQPMPVAPAPLEPRKSTSVLTWVGFSVAGVGLASGLVTGSLAMTKTSKAKELCEDNYCPPSTHEDLKSARLMATASTISFIVAGVGVGVGIIGLTTSSSETRETQVGPLRNVTPTIGLGTFGFAGRF